MGKPREQRMSHNFTSNFRKKEKKKNKTSRCAAKALWGAHGRLSVCEITGRGIVQRKNKERKEKSLRHLKKERKTASSRFLNVHLTNIMQLLNYGHDSLALLPHRVVVPFVVKLS